MTADGWKAAIRSAKSDDRQLQRLADLLSNQEYAYTELSLSFGWVGISWPELVAQIKAAFNPKPDRLSIEE